MNRPIDRTAAVDVVWLAVGVDRACIVTTEVEAPRLADEHRPDLLGLDLVAVPWWDPQAFISAAADVIVAEPDAIGSDGHRGFGHDLTVPLTQARLALDPIEQEQLRALGADAAAAVEGALRAWIPGERDLDVASRIAGSVEAAGGQAPVLLVGGDDRLYRFRHPVAVGQKLEDSVMAVLVAARDGLHVALTRYASARPVGDDLAAGLCAVRRIHRRTLAASRPGATAGAVMTVLAEAYASEGADRAWSQHYQGGPIGYAQREFEISPAQTTSPWWSTELPSGCAVGWNPSLAGGAKDEDTYLITEGAPELITFTTDWPVADDELPARPAVLVAGA